jgi:thiol-disulfide isomerase/thioredoxin
VDTLKAAARNWLPWVVLIGFGLYVASQMQSAATIPAGAQIGDLLEAVAEDLNTPLEKAPGEVVVLNFWATWCGPCKKEAPVLSALHAQGVRVIGVSVDKMPKPRVVERARQIGMDYEIGVGSSRLLQRFQVNVVPTTYVVGADGVVVLSRAGYVSQSALADAIETARDRG